MSATSRNVTERKLVFVASETTRSEPIIELIIAYGRLGNFLKSGARFSLYASRPSWPSSLM